MFAALSRLSALLSFFTEPLGAISSTVRSPRFGYATWTSTFAAREALPAHAVTATAETAVPRSRMAASVPLARTLHGWAGAATVLGALSTTGCTTGAAGVAGVAGVAMVPGTTSSRFGEPEPGLVTAPPTEPATSASRTCAGDADGFAARYSAAVPATCGVAIDVPLMTAVPSSAALLELVMPTPGAKMSTQEP